nr:MAG TPA: hypothetical protein [Bacteriophage sp.]
MNLPRSATSSRKSPITKPTECIATSVPPPKD